MPPLRYLVAAAALALSVIRPGHAAAQDPAFEVAYGFWWADDDTTARVFHAAVNRRFVGSLGWGLGFVHVQDSRDSLRRTLSGGEFSLSLGREGDGLYALGSVGLGVLHGTGSADAFWTVGAGYAVRLFSALNLGLEARYRAEDTRVGGFWQLDPADRRGVQVQARLAFGIGAGGRGMGGVATGGSGEPGAPPSAAGPTPGGDRAGSGSSPPSEGTAPRSPLPAPDPYSDALRAGATEEAARLTASVVESALGAMGSPYQWGGTDANGFDCSGLIQYAYGKFGIVLPRMSRDQARMGRAVDREVGALRPGDVLAFSEAGTASRVTHVGLYIGEGQFIHSSSTGVKLSSLRAEDGDSRWWHQRWVGARRIVE